MLQPRRKTRYRFSGPLALLAAALVHLAVFYYLRAQIKAMTSFDWMHDDVLTITIQPEAPKRGVVRKAVPKQAETPPAPEPEAKEYLVTTNAPAELPAAQPKAQPQGAEGAGVPDAVSDIGSLDNVEFAPLFNPSPHYPEIARAAGIEGYVLVELLIDERGFVLEYKIIEVWGHAQFGKETENVIRKWRFPQPRINGKPARVRYVYKVIFKLG